MNKVAQAFGPETVHLMFAYYLFIQRWHEATFFFFFPPELVYSNMFLHLTGDFKKQNHF